jgi:DNA-directed RNA polymerase specialized sigma24 family protein
MTFLRFSFAGRAAAGDPVVAIEPDRVLEPDESDLFVLHLPTIHAVVASVARRHHLRADERDEFFSRVSLALLDRNSEVLREHASTGSMAAYLHVVVSRLFFDYRTETWGRWRPSAAARRQGPVGVLLERLICRDGLPFDTAAQVACVNHGVELTQAELWQVFTSLLPMRVRWQSIPVTDVDVPSHEPGPHEAVLMEQRALTKERILAALARGRAALPAEDRLILQMRIDDGYAVSQIATTLGLNRRKLYTRFDKLFRQLREFLFAEGISTEDVSDCLGPLE